MSSNKQKETEKFVGCILSVKTKPGQLGDIQHIIGTVREIDVNSAEQAIVLDQAMSNGAMLPDGYVLLSSQIADLQVMGKANEIEANLKSAYSRSSTITTKPKNSSEQVHASPVNNSVSKSSGVLTNSGNHVGLGYVNGGESLNKNVNGNHVNNGSMALMNSITSAMADFNVRSNQSEKNDDSGCHMIAKPKPRKPGDGSTNITSSPQKQTPLLNKTGIQNIVSSSNREVPSDKSNSTKIGLSAKSDSKNDGNILMRTFGNMSTNAGVTVNGQALFNAVANSSKSNAVPVTANLKPANSAESPSKLSSQKPMVYDHKKLGVLSKFVSVENNEENLPQLAVPKTPKNKTVNNTQNDPKLTRSQGKGNGRQLRHGETFESMSKSEMTVDFDFEGSNAQFEKLPVTSSKPTRVTKTPQFCTTDTTYLAERVVESITVKETVTSVKQFVTDTGVAIPSVDLPTRSKILNLAHEAGLTHSRVVEVMGRAVAQAAIPLLGDSYRLSPERPEDRPWILVCVGPHWQGAIGIAAARILASLGVHTCVHAPKEELQLCATEELLYRMSGETLTRQIKDLKGYKFELVIMAVDDHLSRTLTLSPYARWLKSAPVVFVDPPLISSYRQQLDGVCGGIPEKGRKIVIVSPVLPIAYPTDTSVKIFLVNLGIPNDIFEGNHVVYKSPFGDKLVIQIFSSSPK